MLKFIYELHLVGGVNFMFPLALLLLTNLGLIGFVILRTVQKQKNNSRVLELIRQLGGLALAWGVFSTVIGLFFAFGALEEMKDTLPFEVIMGGLKVALITALYGMIIFIISLAAYIGLNFLNKNTSA
jgi:hypothetical protein